MGDGAFALKHCDELERINVIMGDITSVSVDAIVNAASHSLLGLSGVSGAIFHAAGKELYEECRNLGGCPEGEARITAAYRLAANHIIHTVGPVWRGGTQGEEHLLAQCYQSCFELIRHHQHRTVAFPSIGTGAHGIPLEVASRIAIDQLRGFLNGSSDIERITIVCFDESIYNSYHARITAIKCKSIPTPA